MTSGETINTHQLNGFAFAMPMPLRASNANTPRKYMSLQKNMYEEGTTAPDNVDASKIISTVVDVVAYAFERANYTQVTVNSESPLKLSIDRSDYTIVQFNLEETTPPMRFARARIFVQYIVARLCEVVADNVTTSTTPTQQTQQQQNDKHFVNLSDHLQTTAASLISTEAKSDDADVAAATAFVVFLKSKVHSMNTTMNHELPRTVSFETRDESAPTPTRLEIVVRQNTDFVVAIDFTRIHKGAWACVASSCIYWLMAQTLKEGADWGAIVTDINNTLTTAFSK